MADCPHSEYQEPSPTIKELLIKLDVQMTYISNDIKKIEQNYITKNEFAPVQKLVYGGAGLMLTLILGALVSLILK